MGNYVYLAQKVESSPQTTCNIPWYLTKELAWSECLTETK